MQRLYEPSAYDGANYDDCYWKATTDLPEFATLEGGETADVAIIGAGYTGLSAALHLAQKGRSVVVLDAEHPGWGASGRSGGFCCVGGGIASDHSIKARFGSDAVDEWHQTERAAIRLVRDLIHRFDIDADVHSNGETQLAHSPRAMARLRNETGAVTEREDLASMGICGPFFGASTSSEGFALNPLKYITGLLKACGDAGVRVFSNSPVVKILPGEKVQTARGEVIASNIVLATNGYSSEDLPPWMRSRFLPVFSSIMVTRPLTTTELARQGWTSRQMCYDTRQLLHYFRLLPENRMLFGMRGGLKATDREERRVNARLRRNFDRFFPEWRKVEATHVWSGLVCLLGDGLPFVGPIPGARGLWAGLGYHGNGVAMGSWSGRLLANAITGLDEIPVVLRTPPGRFPLGMARRALLRPAYAAAKFIDLF